MIVRRAQPWLLATLTVAVIQTVPVPAAPSPDIVISQVYGGGGNTGATLRNDYIELFNRGTATVSVSGWSVQYASAGGITWQRTLLSGEIHPGQYYLVQQAAGAGGTVDLPAPDATGSIAMSATAGKVALVSSATLLAGSCPLVDVRDFIGYGAATCSETTPAPTLSNTTADLRNPPAPGPRGCQDTDNNSADFHSTRRPWITSSSARACSGIGRSSIRCA